jgi:hypothetical protein
LFNIVQGVENMGVKILIFSGYGSNAVTPEMEEIMNISEGIRRRVGEIVEFVEKNAVPYKIRDYKIANEDLSTNHNLIVRYEKYPGVFQYAVWDRELRMPSFFSIDEVDSSRPWTVEEYDGSEGIVYLDERKLTDEELNYWDCIEN